MVVGRPMPIFDRLVDIITYGRTSLPVRAYSEGVPLHIGCLTCC